MVDFPNNPVDQDLFTSGGTTWQWNASPLPGCWQVIRQQAGPTVPGQMAPPALQSTVQGEILVTLAQDPPNSGTITQYDIQRATDPTAGPWTLIGDITSPYNDTGLTPSVTYYYQTRAHNANGPGAWSASASEVAAGASVPSQPGAPILGRGTNTEHRTITVTFPTDPDDNGSPITSWVMQASIDQQGWLDKGTWTDGQDYEWVTEDFPPESLVYIQVAAVNANGQGPWSPSSAIQLAQFPEFTIADPTVAGWQGYATDTTGDGYCDNVAPSLLADLEVRGQLERFTDGTTVFKSRTDGPYPLEYPLTTDRNGRWLALQNIPVSQSWRYKIVFYAAAVYRESDDAAVTDDYNPLILTPIGADGGPVSIRCNANAGGLVDVSFVTNSAHDNTGSWQTTNLSSVSVGQKVEIEIEYTETQVSVWEAGKDPDVVPADGVHAVDYSGGTTFDLLVGMRISSDRTTSPVNYCDLSIDAETYDTLVDLPFQGADINFGNMTPQGYGEYDVSPASSITSGDPSGHWQIVNGMLSPSAVGGGSLVGPYTLTLNNGAVTTVATFLGWTAKGPTECAAILANSDATLTGKKLELRYNGPTEENYNMALQNRDFTGGGLVIGGDRDSLKPVQRTLNFASSKYVTIQDLEFRVSVYDGDMDKGNPQIPSTLLYGDWASYFTLQRCELSMGVPEADSDQTSPGPCRSIALRARKASNWTVQDNEVHHCVKFFDEIENIDPNGAHYIRRNFQHDCWGDFMPCLVNIGTSKDVHTGAYYIEDNFYTDYIGDYDYHDHCDFLQIYPYNNDGGNGELRGLYVRRNIFSPGAKGMNTYYKSGRRRKWQGQFFVCQANNAWPSGKIRGLEIVGNIAIVDSVWGIGQFGGVGFIDSVIIGNTIVPPVDGVKTSPGEYPGVRNFPAESNNRMQQNVLCTSEPSSGRSQPNIIFSGTPPQIVDNNWLDQSQATNHWAATPDIFETMFMGVGDELRGYPNTKQGYIDAYRMRPNGPLDQDNNGVFSKYDIGAVGTDNTNGISDFDNELINWQFTDLGGGATKPDAMTSGDWSALTGASSGQIDFTVITPPDDGGSAITDYEYTDDSGSNWYSLGISTATTVTISGFGDGASVNVAIRAVNAIGSADISDTKAVTAGSSPAAVPDAMTAGDWSGATGSGSGEIDLTLTTAPYDGGDPITDYEYDLDFAASWQSMGFAALPNSYTIAGLVASQAYDVRVRARNSIGGATGSDTKNIAAGAAGGATPIELIGSGIKASYTNPNSNVNFDLGAGAFVAGDRYVVMMLQSHDGTITNVRIDPGTANEVEMVQQHYFTNGGTGSGGQFLHCWDGVALASAQTIQVRTGPAPGGARFSFYVYNVKTRSFVAASGIDTFPNGNSPQVFNHDQNVAVGEDVLHCTIQNSTGHVLTPTGLVEALAPYACDGRWHSHHYYEAASAGSPETLRVSSASSWTSPRGLSVRYA